MPLLLTTMVGHDALETKMPHNPLACVHLCDGCIVSHCADPSARKRRKKMGGNSGKNFSEGWAEFEDKRVAKAAAQMLNGNAMGGKRRSAYHYDLWCVKYLRGFKWDHLTEEIGALLFRPLPPSSQTDFWLY